MLMAPGEVLIAININTGHDNGFEPDSQANVVVAFDRSQATLILLAFAPPLGDLLDSLLDAIVCGIEAKGGGPHGM